MLINQWIIGLIDRLKDRFDTTGFAYGYEMDTNQHVVEISDAHTFESELFQDALIEEWLQFHKDFPQDSILFIGSGMSTPLQTVQYKVGPKRAELQPIAVPVEEIFGSYSDPESVRQVQPMSVEMTSLTSLTEFRQPVGNYSYAMAA